MKRKVYLLDDEPLALTRLTRLLDGRVEIVGQSTNPRTALAEITPEIELVFLDISMPELDGFGVAAELPPSVMVVFTTAHDEHALRAFEVNAIDYLVKPIQRDALDRALDKLERLRAAGAKQPLRIVSRLGHKLHLVELERVSHFTAEDKLTYAHAEGKSYVVDPSISELEDSHPEFVRIHRATLVRLTAIVELQSGPARVRLADGTELAVARERTRALKDRLGV
jgi:two-component system LytT family response regulator